ncbi:hypothetical protein LCGC14_1066810 [marine sediment metagenome]|uniref:Uncharacterized protein n=1 Tax=marine sediment metagenome TaxID=412755 RepID=A0A0F9MJE5_9ZZZZ
MAENETISRPDYVKEEHLIFLDDLRESGVTNMYGARPYLMDEFEELESETAGNIVGYWMETFNKEDR